MSDYPFECGGIKASDLTPEVAVEQRALLVKAFTHYSDAIVDQQSRILGMPRDEAKGQVEWIRSALPRTDVVLWKRDVWEASQVGRDAFEGTPLRGEEIPKGFELWVLPFAVRLSEGVRSFMHLVVPCPVTERYSAGSLVMLSIGMPTNAAMPLFKMSGWTDIGEPVPAEATPIVAALAFKRLKLASLESAILTRQCRRRLERQGQELPTIRIVTLRKRERASGGVQSETDREYSCQWIVGGHWRQQACGVARSERRPTYIQPYVKGPADKPLKQPRETVYVVKR